MSSVLPGAVIVRFSAAADCERCQRGEGCGAGVFSRLFRLGPSEICLPAEPGPLAVAGAQVEVGIEGRQLAGLAIRHYGLPLVAFLLAALLMQQLFADGLLQDFMALGGGLLALALAMRLSKHRRTTALNLKLRPLSCSSNTRIPMVN